MKKRLLSILLTLCMVLCLVPTSVFAEGVTSKKVETQQELVAALADNTVDVIKLGSDIAIDATLNITRTVTLDLVGYMLEMKGSGSVIKVEDGGHLTLVDSDLTSTYYFTPDANGLWKWGTSGTKTVNGGVIYGGTGTAMYYYTYGGGVLIEDGGQFTMNGGSIVGCSADSGGGVKVECGDANGTFTMNGGAIIGCVANSGGGVETDYYSNTIYGKFIMNGGVIDSCVATEREGGGVSASAPFVMEGGEIKNCVATNGEGGGVFLGGGLEVTHTLNGKIDNGTAAGEKYIYLNNSHATIGAAAQISANITLAGGTIALADGVTGATVYGKITDGCFADGLVAVTYKVNGTDYATQILKSGSVAIRPADPAVPTGRTFDGWYKTDGAKWEKTALVTENLILTGWLYVPVTNETELVAALQDDTVGMIRLVNDITLPRLKMSIIIRDGRQLILDLGGYVLDLGENTGISVGGNTAGIMTIMDSRPNEPHKFTPNADGLWVWDNGTGTGTETVLGGVITGSEGSSGSAIHAAGSGGMVIMNAGNIVGHRNGDGGAVSITAGGQFTMNGGSIMGCYASGKGGAVYVVKSTFTLVDGVIKSCKAGGVGGAVYVAGRSGDGIFTMTGGSIADCTDTNGSALYLKGGKMNAGGGTVDGTVVLDVNSDGKKGVIQGSGSNATHFSGDVTNYGEIGHGTFSGTVTLGNSTLSGTISGGIFNGPVTTALEGEAAIGGGVFNKTVTINRGEITNGIFNKDVVVDNARASSCCTTLTGGTYNGLIINKSAYAAFAGAHSPLGIVETKPSSQYSNDRYRTVTFDPAGGTMDYPVRYFLDSGNISAQIVPDSRVGYFFAGWYNGENKWNYSDTVGEDDLTLTAHWTACDHSGHTGAQPTCTTSVTCTACGGEIAELGHDWGAWTSNGNGTHTHICRRDNTHTETKDCLGGEATCSRKAICTDCGKAYGDLDPVNHKGGKQEWTQTKTTHEKKWNCCGDVIVASEAHEWSDGACSECGYKCLHNDTDENHICDICEKIISNHEDADKDHICDYCGKTISNHEDADNDHVCDYCKKVISNHEDADKNHICDYCEKVITNHEDTDKNHICDYCEKIISNHEDADKNHVCDYCGKTISNHEDTDNNHICDHCGKIITNHTGGKATCAEKAVCEVCGKAYGELDANHHADLKHIEAKAATKDAEGNTEYWYCEACGKYYDDAAATKEIKIADTVTAKLPDDSKSPKTGDNSNLMLWFALLFISGGICTALTLKRKKSH